MRNQEMDKLLDHALQQYREAEPLAGFEDRVLQRLAVHTVERRQLAHWKMAGAIAFAALLAFAVWLGLRSSRDRTEGVGSTVRPGIGSVPPQNPDSHRDAAAPTKKATEDAALMRRRSGRQKPTKLILSSNAQAQPDQFPSAVPLTPEEHALIVLARNAPAVLSGDDESDRHLTIHPLEIKPLAPENGAGELQ